MNKNYCMKIEFEASSDKEAKDIGQELTYLLWKFPWAGKVLVITPPEETTK